MVTCEERLLPQKMLEWCPPGRKRNGRPRNSRMQEVTGMREKGINIEWAEKKGVGNQNFSIREMSKL